MIPQAGPPQYFPQQGAPQHRLTTADLAISYKHSWDKFLPFPTVLLWQTPLHPHLCGLGADRSIKIRIAEVENSVILGCPGCLVSQTPVG